MLRVNRIQIELVAARSPLSKDADPVLVQNVDGSQPMDSPGEQHEKKTGSCGCSKINENHRFWLIHIHPHLDVSNRKFNRIHRFTQANMKSSPATNWDLTIPKAQMRNSPLVSDPPSLASTFSMQRWLSGLCHQCGGDPRSSTSKAFNKLLLSIFGWGYDVYG